MINGLGERLQEQRTTHKLSQREVALALNVSPTVISNYERESAHQVWKCLLHSRVSTIVLLII